MTKDTLRLPSAFRAPAELAQMPHDTPILLAFSGGADSRALLHMLACLAKERGFRLVLAHVEHGIRGEESRKDLEFCKRIASQYGLELYPLCVDVPALARESGRGLEEEAREVRYAFFDRLMKEQGIPLLATAHHADDQAETLLFRLCRGTGLNGLSGIAPVRELSFGVLTRPLLHLSKQEILDYCAENQLEFVTDETNSDRTYARNRIRAEVIPVMEALFDGSAKRMAATADDLREDARLLEEMAEECRTRARMADGLSLEVLRSVPPPICRRTVRRLLAEQLGRTLERVHTDAVMRLILEEIPHARAALPCGKSAVVEFGCLRLISDDGTTSDIGCVPLTEGTVSLGKAGIRASVTKNDEEKKKIHNSDTEIDISLNADSVMMKETFFWRSRRDGDVVLMHGMHKKLRRLLREANIPPRLRDEIPLLCDREGIVWVPFVGLRDGFGTEGDSYRVSVEIPTITSKNDKDQ